MEKPFAINQRVFGFVIAVRELSEHIPTNRIGRNQKDPRKYCKSIKKNLQT
jgi:hypothetical protein